MILDSKFIRKNFPIPDEPPGDGSYWWRGHSLQLHGHSHKHQITRVPRIKLKGVTKQSKSKNKNKNQCMNVGNIIGKEIGGWSEGNQDTLYTCVKLSKSTLNWT